jgi:Cft2 family RNA processing exonuclease
LVRNAKAKIRRANKAYGVNLYEEINLPSIEDIGSRQEFNKIKKEAKSFTSRQNENYQFKKNKYGVVATKKELKEIIADTKEAQKIAKKLIKETEKKPFYSGKKVQGTVGQQIKQMAKPNVAGIYAPPDFNFNSITSTRQFENKKKNMKERASGLFVDKRMEQNKQNFIRMLELSMHSDADELIEMLENLSGYEFHEIYMQFASFDFNMWDSEGIMAERDGQSSNHISKMMDDIEMYNDGKVDKDLWGF